MAVPDTGILHIDALILNKSWTGNANTPATINWSYGEISDSQARNLTPENNVFDVTASLDNAVRSVMGVWATYAYVDFDEAPPSAIASVPQPLMIAQTNEGIDSERFAGITFFYDDEVAKLDTVDIIVAQDYAGAAMSPGGFGYFTLLHEFGHALGLEHPFEDSSIDTAGEGILPASEDSYDLTIMSYTDGIYANVSNLPVTPMLYDIAAIQYLYGANRSIYAGNNTHPLTDGMRPFALWDAGGTDALDSTSYGADVILDLREGASFVNRVGSTAAWMAFGSNIENAISGVGNDVLNGNSAANALTGGSGNDTLVGNEGNDYLQANQGGDFISGGTGADEIYGGKDNDTIRGGRGADVINGNLGNDQIFADNGPDTARGGQGDDVVSGGDGNDVLLGDRGSDTLLGDTGNDIFRFEQQDATTDVIQDFAAGEDLIQFSSILFASREAALEASSFDSASGLALIALPGEGLILLEGLGTALTAADFIIG